MEHKALGKGLSALIPEKILDTKSVAVSFIKIDKVKFNSFQPRSHYDKQKQEELIASIKEKGVLQPILVREIDGQYEVIAGERRLRAAQSLNLTDVPAIIKTVSDTEALILALVENIQREELNPIEEAKAYQKLINEFQFTQDSIAKSVSKDRTTITNTIRLLKLPEEIQQYIFQGQITPGHARALLSIEDPKRQRELFQRILDNGISVREAERFARQESCKGKKARLKSPSKAPDIIALEEELQTILGTRVQIQANKKIGKILIEFYSLDELERIINTIKK